MKFLGETISYHTARLISLVSTFSHTQLSISFILSTGGMLVRSSHPIIQSACSLLGISLTMHLFSSLTHLHTQFTTHDFHILLPSHSPPKQPLHSPLWYQLQYWACRAPQFPFQLSYPHAPPRLGKRVGIQWLYCVFNAIPPHFQAVPSLSLNPMQKVYK